MQKDFLNKSKSKKMNIDNIDAEVTAPEIVAPESIAPTVTAPEIEAPAKAAPAKKSKINRVDLDALEDAPSVSQAPPAPSAINSDIPSSVMPGTLTGYNFSVSAKTYVLGLDRGVSLLASILTGQPAARYRLSKDDLKHYEEVSEEFFRTQNITLSPTVVFLFSSLAIYAPLILTAVSDWRAKRTAPAQAAPTVAPRQAPNKTASPAEVESIPATAAEALKIPEVLFSRSDFALITDKEKTLADGVFYEKKTDSTYNKRGEHPKQINPSPSPYFKNFILKLEAIPGVADRQGFIKSECKKLVKRIQKALDLNSQVLNAERAKYIQK